MSRFLSLYCDAFMSKTIKLFVIFLLGEKQREEDVRAQNHCPVHKTGQINANKSI